MTDIECDVAIIGAGTAGLAAERAARKAGATTRLIDPEFDATTCAEDGCMPSKLLIAAASAAHGCRSAMAFGIEPGTVKVDGRAVMARVRDMRAKFVEATLSSMAEIPDGVRVKARAAFTGPTTLSLGDGRTLSAKAVVVAAGAFPVVPDAFDAVRDLCLTHRTVFDIEDLPGRLGVIGAGPLGLELAQAMARLGVDVTVFDQEEALAGLPPGAPNTSLRKAVERELRLVLGHDVEAEPTDDGVRLVAGDASVTVDRVLIAAGRPPALDGLDLEATGLELDERGSPKIDPSTMQCGDAPIFMAGDIAGFRPVLHEASHEGTIAGSNAAAFPDVRSFARKVEMAIAFTHPNAAVIGQQPGDDTELVTGRMSYEDQGRAKVENRNVGCCELHGAPDDGKLLGATLVGPDVEHLAHLLAWTIQCEKTATEILDLPFYHPTVEEGLKDALSEICKQVSTDEPADRDDEGYTPGDTA